MTAAETPTDLGIAGYEGAAVLGRGGYGTVYRAYQPDLDRMVAIKVLAPAFSDEELRARFERERKALGSLSEHPHIVTVHDWGHTGEGIPYLVMEYLAGGSLADRIRLGSLRQDETVAIVAAIASALDAAHQAGVLHRDVKPENVLLSSYGEARLADFGLAAIAGATATAGPGVSLNHVAPEILNGEAASPPADVYGLASTAYTLLAGNPPFATGVTDSPAAVLARVLGDAPPDLRPEVSDQTWEALAQGLAKQPNQRYSTAGEFAAALAATFQPATAKRAGNLPAATTKFVGRQDEIVGIAEKLTDHRLVTLTGLGGIGKTRLAIETAAEVIDRYPGGAWLVELAEVDDPGLVDATTAAALGIDVGDPSAVRSKLIERLSPNRILLVLDNCEHVLGAAADLAEAALRASPQLSILATSRQPLGLPGEAPAVIPPMLVPPPDAEAETMIQAESVALFAERAAIVWPGFILGDNTAERVAEICRRLDGIPLAIEFAAGRLGYLSLDDVANRLDDRFRLLTDARTGDDRHHTLLATLDWSYDLLNEPQRTLLRRLSVFAAGFTLEAAETVCSGDLLDRLDILDLLARLVDSSLVVVQRNPQIRYDLLEVVNDYAAEKLAAAGETATLMGRHAEYYTALAEEAAPHLWGLDQRAWFARVSPDYENIRSALSFHIEHGSVSAALRITDGLFRFWQARGYLSEGSRYFEAIVARLESLTPPEQATALRRSASYLYMIDERETAKTRAEEGLILAREVGDPDPLSSALNNLGNYAVVRGDLTEARAYLEESLALVRTEGDPGFSSCFPLMNLGELEYAQGNLDAAVALLDESIEVVRQSGDEKLATWPINQKCLALLRRGDLEHARRLAAENQMVISTGLEGSQNEGQLHHVLGEIALAEGDAATALAEVAESLRISRALGTQERVPWMYLLLSRALALAGRREEATQALGLEAGLMDRFGYTRFPMDEDPVDTLTNDLRADLGEERFEALYAAGEAVHDDDALETALSWTVLA